MSIIKGLAALLAPRWDPAALTGQTFDLTKPDSGVTREEREALFGAAGVIAGTVVDLEAYRATREGRGTAC